MKKQARRLLWLCAGILVPVGLYVIYVHPFRGFSISRETTCLTDERWIRDDGTVDYAGYLDEKYGADIRPEDNAAVLLVKAFGPGSIDEDIRDAFLESNRFFYTHIARKAMNAPIAMHMQAVRARGDCAADCGREYTLRRGAATGAGRGR